MLHEAVLCYGLTYPKLYAAYQTEVAVGSDEEARWLELYGNSSVQYRKLHGDPVVFKYGETDAEVLRIHKAERSSVSPTLLNIHGGYWRAGSPDWVDFVAGGMIPKGINVINIGYGRMPQIPMSEIVRQVRLAVSTIYTQAQKLNIDPDKFFVTGHSAGGHLAAVLAGTKFENLPGGNPLKGMVSVSGLNDLQFALYGHLSREPNPILLTPEDAVLFAPVYMRPQIKGPVTLVVGAQETDEFYRQALLLESKWNRRGANCITIDVPGVHHYSLYHQFSEPDSSLSRLVYQQMGIN